MTKEEVIEVVEKCVKKHENKNWPLEILEEGVRREDGWWYVPIRPGQITDRGMEYYDLLAQIEEDLMDEKKLNVLLVPAGPDEPDS